MNDFKNLLEISLSAPFESLRMQLYQRKKQSKDCFFLWPARRDSNPRSSESESAALSNCATGGYQIVTYEIYNICAEKSREKRRIAAGAERFVIFILALFPPLWYYNITLTYERYLYER